MVRSQSSSEVSVAELLCEGLAASAAAEVELEPLGEALEPWNGWRQPMPEVEPLRWAQMMRALNKSGLTQILHFVGLIPANTADFGVVDSVNGAAAALRMPSQCRSWYLGRKLSLEMARSSQINGVFYGHCGTCCCR